MKIQYLGTAAVEGIPGIFCECENCKKTKQLGGKNIRTRSQALIDGRILIDFPADTYMHYLKCNIPLDKIKTCIITHSHSDHLYPIEIEMRINGYAHISSGEPLTFLTQNDLNRFANMLNNLPRRTLNYYTPTDLFNNEIPAILSA